VAAHLEPEILIVDEVLAVGDAQFQKKCLGKMHEVGNSGRTVLFVSHNLNAIEQLCSRCMLLEHGELKLDSSDVKNVVKSYVMEASGGSKPAQWRNENNSFENPWFKPTWLGICDRNGNKINGPVRNDVDLFVRVEGEVTKYNEKLAIAYYVYNEENILLYQSATHDKSEDKFPKFKIGFNVLTGELPCRMFNEGEYRIELVVFLHGERCIIQQMQNAPSIFLEIHGGFTHSPRWTAKRAGILAPVLEWRIW
jgi:lipopolysaccharide transport system ATP-binding protein